MSKTIVARWTDWEGRGLQHLILRESANEIVAEADAIATTQGGLAFTARFRIVCDGAWRARTFEGTVLGDERLLHLTSDGEGHWKDGQGKALPDLDGALDVDLVLTPFTNTLPIRRLALRARASADIRTAYISLPEFTVEPDPQRYTCLKPLSRYRYESLDSDFTREIDVDANGLVVTYPDLFKRVL